VTAALIPTSAERYTEVAFISSLPGYGACTVAR
jgi:hypothetical protein